MTRIETFSGGEFQENGYLVLCGEGGPGVVIDPGAAASSMVRRIREEGVEVAAILLTHAHLDHVDGIPSLRKITDAPIYLHPQDRRLYDGVELQARAFHLPSVGPLPPPDRELEHGEALTFGGVRFQVRHAPGHAPGHVLFFLEEEGTAFVGDVVFAGSIGRTDLVGGSYPVLMESIREQVLTLPDDTRLFCGHGPETTVGRERLANPFLLGEI